MQLSYKHNRKYCIYFLPFLLLHGVGVSSSLLSAIISLTNISTYSNDLHLCPTIPLMSSSHLIQCLPWGLLLWSWNTFWKLASFIMMKCAKLSRCCFVKTRGDSFSFVENFISDSRCFTDYPFKIFYSEAVYYVQCLFNTDQTPVHEEYDSCILLMIWRQPYVDLLFSSV